MTTKRPETQRTSAPDRYTRRADGEQAPKKIEFTAFC